MHALDDSYSLAVDPQAVVARLIADKPEFQHLTRARIVCMLSQQTPMLRGCPCWAFVGRPSVQGPYKALFDWMLSQFVAPLLDGDDVEYLIVFDAAIWPSLDAIRQERLCYHELCHLQPREAEDGSGIRLDREGRPQLKVVPHDAEFFFDEVRTYGPEVTELHDAVASIVEGQAAANARQAATETVPVARR